MDKPNTPKQPKPTATTGSMKYPHPLKKLSVVITLVVIIGVVIGIILSTHGSNQPYNYRSLIDSKLQNSLNTIEFQRPQEFALSSKDSTLQKSVYTHTVMDKQGKATVLGSISAYATHSIIAANPQIDLTVARAAFNSRQGTAYQTYAKAVGINDFLSSELAVRYFNNASVSTIHLTLNRPSVLTTANLKQDSWLFAFSATGVRGELVFNLGKSTSVYHGYNYFMISSPNYNWQPNAVIWQQIVNSIKVSNA